MTVDKPTRVAVFSTKPYDKQFINEAAEHSQLDFTFFEPRLTTDTALLAQEHQVVCAFVNDELSASVLLKLSRMGVKLIALRSAGFNNVNVEAATEFGIDIVRVPAYSPHSVAEHTVALILGLNRNLHRAYTRVRDGNFSLEGLLGFDLNGKTVGVIGTGRIGRIFGLIMKGFGCHVLAYDKYPNDQFARDAEYTDRLTLLAQSDIISLHTPLTPETYHIIDRGALYQMKPGAMLVNTSRGALIDTQAVINALKDGQLGGLAIDVYEEEADLFFEDLSNYVLQDDTFARLLTFPNVLITGHQAFFTVNALRNIAETTVSNITYFRDSGEVQNAVTLALIK